MTTPASSIFVIGNSRSGTTMMSRILGNHPLVFTFQELHFFDELLPVSDEHAKIASTAAVKLYASLMTVQRNGYFGSKYIKPFLAEAQQIAADKKSCMDVYSYFLQHETRLNKKSIACEQTPQNIFSTEAILKQIPDAKFILMVRDPREVLLSQKNKWKRRKLSGGEIPFWESVRSRINYHPVTISKIWRSVMKEATRLKDNPAVLIIKYEDLLCDTQQTIRSVCAHTGINYLPDLTDIPVIGSSNISDSKTSRGIDTSKRGMWQKGGLSPAEIYLCQEIARKQMKLYGYESVPETPKLLHLIWFRVSLPFQLMIALCFNLKRLKNPRKLLKRFVS